MEAALRIDESDEDMTAAETAPSPTKDTNPGVRNCSTMGSTKDVCSLSSGKGPVNSVSFHLVALATAPMIIAGMAMTTQPKAAT